MPTNTEQGADVKNACKQKALIFMTLSQSAQKKIKKIRKT